MDIKSAVIDVGSNSVRLMLSINGKTQYKLVKITRLAEGYDLDGYLTKEAIKRTALAINEFVEKALLEKVNRLFIFATAAVRNSKNGKEFCDYVQKLTGQSVEIVSGEIEAKLGLLGALNFRVGGIIDIGGASTEIITCDQVDGVAKETYSKSVYVGVVGLKNACGQDYKLLDEYIDTKLKEFGSIPKTQFYGIGGTCTSIGSVMQNLEIYDPQKVDGFKIYLADLKKLQDKVFAMTDTERENIVGLQKGRAPVFAGGILLLTKIMQMLKIEYLTVSESDNLEGYLMFKEREYEKKN